MPKARRYSGRPGRGIDGTGITLPDGKGRLVSGRCEYQHIDALALQIADQAVKRQRDAVGDVIVRTGDSASF